MAISSRSMVRRGGLVLAGAKFQAPVVAAITDPAIVSSSQYLNTTRATPPAVEANPKPPVISGTTLTHGNIGDGVGWLVTVPAG